MPKSKTTNPASPLPVPAEVQAWAAEQASAPTFKAARIEMEQPYYHRPDGDGLVSMTCGLTGRVFRVPALAPVLTIVVANQFSGESTPDHETIRVHPDLAVRGVDAVRDALRDAMNEKVQVAAFALREAATFAAVLGSDLPVSWPAYWTVEEGAKLRGVS